MKFLGSMKTFWLALVEIHSRTNGYLPSDHVKTVAAVGLRMLLVIMMLQSS
jgi:hypothetical protein